MKIIIVAPENDNHTVPIKWALESAGYEVVCWTGLAWTEREHASLLFEDQARITLGPYTVEKGDVVWIRRPEQPAHNPKVCEADRKFAETEYRSFSFCILFLLEKMPVWCINKYTASRMINNKSVQLLLARNCGLSVPQALMSNSPQAVRDFMERHQHRPTICKQFMPHIWQMEQTRGVAVTEAFQLTREQLPSDEVLTYAAAIYQDMVVKQFDVRMVLMGNHVYSYSLRTARGVLDWRQDAGQGHIEVEAIATPPEVEKGVLEFARQAGVCFGSLDFAVDHDGRWWFLEINEEGQFLWLDQFNHNLKVQEKFCAFITAPEGSTEPLEKREGLFRGVPEYERLLANNEVPAPAPPSPISPFISREP